MWVIGDATFQKSVLLKEQKHRLTLARYRREGISLHDVLKNVSEKMKVDAQQILRRSTRTLQADARMAFCYIAQELGFPTREVGAMLGIQQAAVTNASRKGSVIVKENNIEWDCKV